MRCPYLDTINRAVLDFDFEKVCSVSLSNLHVYACLVCGKYFQGALRHGGTRGRTACSFLPLWMCRWGYAGRGKSTNAYLHSVEQLHHVFINLETLKVRLGALEGEVSIDIGCGIRCTACRTTTKLSTRVWTTFGWSSIPNTVRSKCRRLQVSAGPSPLSTVASTCQVCV
jgi:hypothetical protein